MVAGAAKDVKEGVALAARALDSGAAKRQTGSLDPRPRIDDSILDKILGYKKEEVAAAKSKANTAELEARAKDAEAPRGFWPRWKTRRKAANTA